jgi:hypothetical protein
MMSCYACDFGGGEEFLSPPAVDRMVRAQGANQTEVHETIIGTNLFFPGERVAIGASGGKDSTVLAGRIMTARASLQLKHAVGAMMSCYACDLVAAKNFFK